MDMCISYNATTVMHTHTNTHIHTRLLSFHLHLWFYVPNLNRERVKKVKGDARMKERVGECLKSACKEKDDVF